MLYNYTTMKKSISNQSQLIFANLYGKISFDSSYIYKLNNLNIMLYVFIFLCDVCEIRDDKNHSNYLHFHI